MYSVPVSEAVCGETEEIVFMRSCVGAKLIFFVQYGHGDAADAYQVAGFVGDPYFPDVGLSTNVQRAGYTLYKS